MKKNRFISLLLIIMLAVSVILPNSIASEADVTEGEIISQGTDEVIVTVPDPEPDPNAQITTDPEPEEGTPTTTDPEPEEGTPTTTDPEPEEGTPTTTDPEPEEGTPTTTDPEPEEGTPTTTDPEPEEGTPTTTDPEPEEGTPTTTDPESVSESDEDIQSDTDQDEVIFEKGYVKVKKDVIVYFEDNKKYENERGSFPEDAVVYAEMERIQENYERSWLKITFDTAEAKESGTKLLTGFVQIRDVIVLSEQATETLLQKLASDQSLRKYGDYVLPVVVYEAKEVEEAQETDQSDPEGDVTGDESDDDKATDAQDSEDSSSEQDDPEGDVTGDESDDDKATDAQDSEDSSSEQGDPEDDVTGDDSEEEATTDDQDSEDAEQPDEQDETEPEEEENPDEPEDGVIPVVPSDANDWKEAPTNLKATASPGRVTLTWSHSGAPYYGYYEVVDGKAKYLGHTVNKTITIEDVSAGTHYYTVYTRKRKADNTWEFGTRPATDASVTVKDWKAAPTLSVKLNGATATLSWGHSGADGYGVYEIVNDKATYLQTVTEKTLKLTNLEPGNHTYTVSARMKFGSGSWTVGNRATNVSVNVGTWTAAPTNLKATVSGSEVTLSWSHAGAEAYGVYEVINGEPVFQKTTTSKSIKLKDVSTGNHIYQIKPRQTDTNGNWMQGIYSSSVSVSVAGWTIAPTGLKATVNYSTVNLSWSYSGDATTFGIYEKNGNSFVFIQLVNEKTAVLDNVEPGTHNFCVAPRKKNSSGQWELGTHSATVKKVVPNWKAAPTNLALTVKGSKIILTWSHEEGAEAYGVYQIVDGKAQFLKVATEKKAEFTELSPGFYEYTVSPRVKDSNGKWLIGERALSVWDNVQEWTAKPTNLKATVNGSKVTLTWSHPGAEAFGIYEVVNSSNSFITTSNTNKAILNNVTPGSHTYLVYSRQKNNSGSWEFGSKSVTIKATVESWTSAPTGLKTTTNGRDVTVSWSHAGAEAYGVYEVVDGTDVFLVVAKEKTAKISKVTPGKHTYVVKPRKKNTEGNWVIGSRSATVSATIADWVAAPVMTSATVTGCQVKLNWTHGGAEAYGVYEVIKGKNVFLQTVTGKNATIKEVTPGTHNYLVYARQKNESNAWAFGLESAPISATIADWAKAPTGVNATVSGSSVKLSWSHAGAEKFGIYEVVDGVQMYRKETEAKNFTLTDVTPGPHTYVVKARDRSTGSLQVGCSSDAITATVASWTAAPTNFSISVTDITVEFSWSHVGGADYIGIYEVVDGKNVLQKTVTGTSYSMTAKDGGAHTYLLYARKKDSNGNWEFGTKTSTKKITVKDYTADNKVIYSLSNSIWTVKKYNGTASSVTIPAKILTLPVKAIGESAFENNASLTTIDLPDSIETIGPKAFKNCTKLANMK